MTGGWKIEPLSRQHDRQSFDCGEAELNDFLRKQARQNAEKDFSRTYVLVRPPSLRITGFYTVCSGSVRLEDVPAAAAKGLPRYPVPVMVLARLAVDVARQGQGLGGDLLIDALRRATRLSDEVGVAAVTVDAMNQRARDFYMKFGFQPLLDDDLHLFVFLKTIRALST
jgi:GNAT superfamily N-acetyltransferase